MKTVAAISLVAVTAQEKEAEIIIGKPQNLTPQKKHRNTRRKLQESPCDGSDATQCTDPNCTWYDGYQADDGTVIDGECVEKFCDEFLADSGCATALNGACKWDQEANEGTGGCSDKMCSDFTTEQCPTALYYTCAMSQNVCSDCGDLDQGECNASNNCAWSALGNICDVANSGGDDGATEEPGQASAETDAHTVSASTTAWSNWSPCTRACGPGEQTRTHVDGIQTETQSCQLTPCFDKDQEAAIEVLVERFFAKMLKAMI